MSVKNTFRGDFDLKNEGFFIISDQINEVYKSKRLDL